TFHRKLRPEIRRPGTHSDPRRPLAARAHLQVLSSLPQSRFPTPEQRRVRRKRYSSVPIRSRHPRGSFPRAVRATQASTRIVFARLLATRRQSTSQARFSRPRRSHRTAVHRPESACELVAQLTPSTSFIGAKVKSLSNRRSRFSVLFRLT